jgi:hypothetical protein
MTPRVDNRPGATYRSAAWRQRVGAGVRRAAEVRRARARVIPSDLRELERSGSVRAELRGALEAAGEEAASLLEALGPDPTPQQQLLVGDVARMGAAIRLEFWRAMQAGDSDSAARIGTLASARRASIALLGLSRHTREVTLAEYIAQHEAAQERASATNGAGPDAQDAQDAERAEGSEP